MTTYADKMPNRMSKYMLEIMTKYMSERTPNIYIYIYMSDRVSENIPDTIFEHPCQIERQNICQIECQNIWQIECKNMWQIGCQYYILADRMPAYKYIYLYIYISDRISEYMADRVAENLSDGLSQIVCQIKRQNMQQIDR